jgi:tetratricopeptide (TPR) repeat protein
MKDRIGQLLATGREHYIAGEYERAEVLLAEATSLGHDFPDVFNMLGVIYHSQGKLLEAEQSFERALILNPRYTEAALNLSVTYNDRGKYDRAKEVYTSAVTSSVGQPNSLDQFARGKLANMHSEIGAAYAAFGLTGEAAREYSKGLDLCPEFADLRVSLANVYREMGMYNAAIAEFEQAKRARPDYHQAGIHLGVTLYSLGRRFDALAEWHAVLKSDPTNKSAKLYIRMVEDANPPLPGSALPRNIDQ